MRAFELRGGDSIPALGLGTWKMDPEVAGSAVGTAIDMGYRHIDCASIYGNEAAIGQAFSSCLKEGKVARKELWVTSKLWNDAHRPEDVRPALQRTLNDLQLDYLDLYLMHWPVAHEPGVMRPENGQGFLSLDQVPLSETWMAMDECRSEGLFRNIGVANFNASKLIQLIDDTSVMPQVNQVELHPLLQQKGLMAFCNEMGVLLTAYSPLGSPDRPDPMKRPDEPSLLDNQLIKEIGKQNQATPGQVLLAWAIQRCTIVIPKAASEKHQRENLEAADISLDDASMQAIEKLDRQYRFVDGTFWEQPGGPYTVKQLWDE